MRNPTHVQPDVVVIPAAMRDPTLVERITLRHPPDKVVQSRRSTGTAFHIIAVAKVVSLRMRLLLLSRQNGEKSLSVG